MLLRVLVELDVLPLELDNVLRLLTDMLLVSELLLLDVDRLRELLDELDVLRLLLVLLDVLTVCELMLDVLLLDSLLDDLLLESVLVELLDELSVLELVTLLLALELVSSTEAIANSPVSGLFNPLADFQRVSNPSLVLNL